MGFPSPGRQQAESNWLLITDVDHTLLGSDRSLAEFQESAENAAGFRYVLNSSRPLRSVLATIEELPVPLSPAGIVTALGTQITVGGIEDHEWQLRFGEWDRAVIDEAMLQIGARPHADEFQTPFKASYAVPPDLRSRAHEVIRATGMPAHVVASGESDFDVLPPEAGKAPAIFHLLGLFDVPPENLIVAGDSGNDIDMFEAAPKGIVVGNAREELKRAVDPRRAYLARKPFAAGVLEGLRHWGVALAES